jgi:hypothetical protein
VRRADAQVGTKRGREEGWLFGTPGDQRPVAGRHRPEAGSLPASVQGGSDGRITRSAKTLVRNWTLSTWPEDRQLATPFGPAGRLEPRAGRASHYPDGGRRRRQLPIRGYGRILNLAGPRGCHAIAPALTTVHTIRSARADAGPRPSGADAAGEAGGRQRAQHGQRDRAAEDGAEIAEVVSGDTDADDRDGEA